MVRRDACLRGGGIEQQLAEGREGRNLCRTFERHIVGSWCLVRRPCQINLNIVADHAHADLNRKALLTIAAIIVEVAFRPVLTIGNGRYPLAKHGFRIVHQLVAGGKDHILAVALHQFDEALCAKPGGCDLCLDVVAELPRGTAVVADEIPHRFVALAAAVDLRAGKQHALGIDVGNVDDQARCGCTDIDMMCCVGGITDEAFLIKNRHNDSEIRRMAGAMIRVVMHHNVTLLPSATIERISDTSEIARY